jgi:hypothetical protein
MYYKQGVFKRYVDVFEPQLRDMTESSEHFTVNFVIITSYVGTRRRITFFPPLYSVGGITIRSPSLRIANARELSEPSAATPTARPLARAYCPFSVSYRVGEYNTS